MIIVFGTRTYGKVDACGGSYLATRFFHIWYLPLIPLGTVQFIEGGARGMDAPFSFRSMFAGYMRVWGVFGTVLLVLGAAAGVSAAVNAADPIEGIGIVAVSGFIALLSLGLTVFAFAWLGRLSLHDKARRLCYAHEIGDPFDPADMQPHVAASLLQSLRARMITACAPYVPESFRGRLDDWPNLAIAPDFRERAFLNLALTLARAESAHGNPPARAHFASLHTHLWQKMQQLGFADLDVAARA